MGKLRRGTKKGNQEEELRKGVERLMKILLVQESDWLKRNPHQQHHLMERLSLRGHEIVVIDYDIDWGKATN